MEVKKNEGIDITLNGKLDLKNYKLFSKEVKELLFKRECLSDMNKLKYSAYLSMNKHPDMKVFGWSSRVVDKDRTSQILFLDYDNMLYRLMREELLQLIDCYDLPPFYIFTSIEKKDKNGEVYGNYLAINLSKHSFRKIVEMQNDTSCDEAYKNIAHLYRFKTWCLRLGVKGEKRQPKFKEIIGDVSQEYEHDVSKGHLEVLKKINSSIPTIKYSNLDKHSYKDITFVDYSTASK